VKVHRYGGQNSWWEASDVEGMLKLQCKRGARTLRYEALREMRFHAIPNLENTRIRRATIRPPTERNHHPMVHTLCVTNFADVISTKISEHSQFRNLIYPSGPKFPRLSEVQATQSVQPSSVLSVEKNLPSMHHAKNHARYHAFCNESC
jgi:hypothetical protein